MRTMRTILTAAALVLLAVPLLAQEPQERLAHLRAEHMKQALELNEEQAAAVAQAMEEVQRATREAHLREQQAFERLRTALGSEPVDQNAIQVQLEAIAREREAIVSAHREQAQRLRQRLSPEQQAKLMIFNHHFDERLRELVTERRGGHDAGRGGRPGTGPGVRPRGGRPGERGPGVGPRGEGPRGDSQVTPDEEVARLRQRITELERRIEEIEDEDED